MRLRGLSIKKRVTLYYSLALILISLLIFSGFCFTMHYQVKAVSEETIKSAVLDSFENIECSDNIIEINSDFDIYEEGVTLLVYGDEGNLIKGSVPRDFPFYTPLSSDEYKTIGEDDKTWLVYDLYMLYENGQGLWVRGIYAMSTTEKTVISLIAVMFAALPFIVLLAVIVGIVITRRAFKPIGEITKTADSISGGSDLSKRLPQGQIKDELYYLTETLNLMMERLEKSFNAEKRFSSDVSHELKTPISVILTECEYMLQKEREGEEYRESLRIIQSQCGKIMTLIGRLLKLSRTINTAETLEKEEIDLSGLCWGICGELEAYAEENGTELIADIDEGITVTADETLTMRMIINLVTNGIKYRRKDSKHPWVKLSLKKGMPVTVTVTDNGIGIGGEHLKNIFNRFYEIDGAEKDPQVSSGLGLAMVKWIADAHGWKVGAESSPGKGSEFTVIL